MASSVVIRIVQQLRRSGTGKVEAWHAAALDTGAFLVNAKLEDAEELLTGIAAIDLPQSVAGNINDLRLVLIGTLSGHIQSRMHAGVPLGVWR